MTKNKSGRIFSILLALIMILGMILNPIISVSAADEIGGGTADSSTAGGSDLSHSIVDSIVTRKVSGGTDTEAPVEIDNVNLWSSFRVDVRFSEDDAQGNQKANVDIKSGDTFTVTWNAPESVEFIGYNQEIDLKPDNLDIVIAKAVITDSGARVTFNDNVNDLQHVKGTLHFSVQTRRKDGSKYTEKGTGTIKSGNITKSITVNPSTDPGKFLEKSGLYQTDGSEKIRWTIQFNGDFNADLTGNITIVDELPATETFISTGFQYDTKDSNEKWNTVAKGLDNFNGLEGYSCTVAGQTMTITIPASGLNEEGGKRGTVTFYTKSIAPAASKVTNIAKMKYKREGMDEPVEITDPGSVTVPDAGGTVDGVRKGTIQISKVVNGSTDPIEGVYFHVYKVKGENDHYRVPDWYTEDNKKFDYAEIVTGKNGVATIANLEDGYYEIEEVSHNLPNWISETSISENLFVTLSGDAGTKVNIENEVKSKTIEATKNWMTADNTSDTGSHPTVYLKLYRCIGSEEVSEVTDAELKKVETPSGESSSSVTWTGLPQYDNTGSEYTYSVKEVDENGEDFTPSGYQKEESGLTVTNKKEKKSVPDTGSRMITVSGKKFWNDNNNELGKRPSSITINLLADGEKIRDTEVDASKNWAYTFYNLPRYANGKQIVYTITENAVTNYKASYDGYNVTNTYQPEADTPSDGDRDNDDSNPTDDENKDDSTPKNDDKTKDNPAATDDKDNSGESPNRDKNNSNSQKPINAVKVTTKSAGSGNTSSTGSSATKIPRTGDSSNIVLYLVLLAAAAVALSGLLAVRRKSGH